MDDFYFEVNPIESRILGQPVNLDVNWSNISGIIFLSREEIYDLSWAGHPNFGFVKISKENIDIIKKLHYDDNILNLLKSKCKDKVSNSRYEKETNPILIDDYFSMQLTEKCKLNMLMKYNECLLSDELKFNWKTLNGFIEFDSKTFLNLYKKIQNYIQNLFELEYNIHKKIDDCKNIEELLDLNLEINCDDKILL